MAEALPIAFSTPAGNQSFERALATAQAAEDAGFMSVTFSDRPHDPVLEGWTLATAVAARTERIRFYHTTFNIPYRYPAVLAKEAATLDIISGGRLDLCLGAGGQVNRPLYESIGVSLPAPGDSLQNLRDAIAILRGMWTQEKFSYEGKAYSVNDAACEPHPTQSPIPIWVGAGLPRSLRLAGEVADGFIKNGGWGSVEELSDMTQKVAAAARRAGRDPNTLRVILNGAGYLAKDKADADAFRAATSGPRPPAGLIGTAEDILELIRQYRNIGVNMFNVRFPAENTLDQIKRFGDEVIPEAAKQIVRG